MDVQLEPKPFTFDRPLRVRIYDSIAETRSTGRGPSGRCAAQSVQARAAAATASSDPSPRPSPL